MHTIKLLLTYYLNISVQAANLSDCRIESNRKNRFGSENRIESNRNFFCPNWNALVYRKQELIRPRWAKDACACTPLGRRYVNTCKLVNAVNLIRCWNGITSLAISATLFRVFRFILICLNTGAQATKFHVCNSLQSQSIFTNIQLNDKNLRQVY